MIVFSVTGGARESVYFSVLVQEMSLFMHVSVVLEEAKSFSLAAGMDFFFLIIFCLGTGKGEVYFSVFFSGRG